MLQLREQLGQDEKAMSMISRKVKWATDLSTNCSTVCWYRKILQLLLNNLLVQESAPDIAQQSAGTGICSSYCLTVCWNRNLLQLLLNNLLVKEYAPAQGTAWPRWRRQCLRYPGWWSEQWQSADLTIGCSTVCWYRNMLQLREQLGQDEEGHVSDTQVGELSVGIHRWLVSWWLNSLLAQEYAPAQGTTWPRWKRQCLCGPSRRYGRWQQRCRSYQSPSPHNPSCNKISVIFFKWCQCHKAHTL